MSSNTKILVLKARELIYTLIFAALGIALILLLIYMFSDKKDNAKPTEGNTSTEQSTEAEAASAVITTVSYIPGNYSSSINLGGTILILNATVDEQGILQASIPDVDETITAMYPLLMPSLSSINSQLANGCSLDNITYSSDSKYTSVFIIDAIKTALDQP